jgi:hypothetical protein
MRLPHLVALVFLGASLLWVLFAIIILILGRVHWELLMHSTRDHSPSYNHLQLSETDRRFTLHRQLAQYFPSHSSGEQTQITPHQRSALHLEVQQLPGNGTGALYYQGYDGQKSAGLGGGAATARA